MQKVTKSVKLMVDEKFLEKFEKVKEYLGLESDAEVVRFLVNAYYRDVVLPRLKEFKPQKPAEEIVAEFESWNEEEKKKRLIRETDTGEEDLI